MSNYLLINDCHLTNESSHPGSCTASYTDDLFDLLYQASGIAYELNCAAMIQLGDLFHIKTPGRNSHALIQRTLRWAKLAPCPLYVVPGNHDLLHDRLESLNEGQPLGVLFDSGIVKMASGYLDNLPVYGVPWQEYWGW